MYKPFNKITEKVIYDAFVESYYWSLPFEVDWVFLKKPSYDYKQVYLESFLKDPNKFVFIYYWPKTFLFVGYVKSNSIKNILEEKLLKDELKDNFVFNKLEIINNLMNNDWKNTDINTHIFVWNFDYQTVIGEYLDYLCGGLAQLLPQHWGDPYMQFRENSPFVKPSTESLKKKDKILQYNALFADWCDKNNNTFYSPCIEFIHWYENKYK